MNFGAIADAGGLFRGLDDAVVAELKGLADQFGGRITAENIDELKRSIDAGDETLSPALRDALDESMISRMRATAVFTEAFDSAFKSADNSDVVFRNIEAFSTQWSRQIGMDEADLDSFMYSIEEAIDRRNAIVARIITQDRVSEAEALQSFSNRINGTRTEADNARAARNAPDPEVEAAARAAKAFTPQAFHEAAAELIRSGRPNSEITGEIMENLRKLADDQNLDDNVLKAYENSVEKMLRARQRIFNGVRFVASGRVSDAQVWSGVGGYIDAQIDSGLLGSINSMTDGLKRVRSDMNFQAVANDLGFDPLGRVARNARAVGQATWNSFGAPVVWTARNITALPGAMRSLLRNPYKGSDSIPFHEAAKVNGEVVASNVLPQWFTPIEKGFLRVRYPGESSMRWITHTTPPHLGMPQMGIARRFMEPVIRHMDAQISGSGVRDAFVRLNADLKKITNDFANGTLDADATRTAIAQRMDAFSSNKEHAEAMAKLREHYVALEKEIESRPALITSGKDRYKPQVGLDNDQRKALLETVRDRIQMLDQFSSSDNAFTEMFTNEFERLVTANTNGRILSNRGGIEDSINETLNIRLGRLGDDVFMRQTGHHAVVSGPRITLGRQAGYQRIHAEANNLAFYTSNTYDRVGRAADLDAASGNVENLTLTISSFHENLKRAADGFNPEWDAGNILIFMGLVKGVFKQGRDDALAQVFTVLAMQRGKDNLRTLPTTIVDELEKMAKESDALDNTRDAARWRNLQKTAQILYDDTVVFGARDIAQRYGYPIALRELTRTIASETGRFELPDMITRITGRKDININLNLSKPWWNDFISARWNNVVRTAAWATGNTTSPGLPGELQTVGRDSWQWNLSSPLRKPESVSDASWDRGGIIGGFGRIAPITGQVLTLGGTGTIARVVQAPFNLTGEVFRYSGRLMSSISHSAADEGFFATNAVRNWTTTPVRASWNLARGSITLPFRSRQTMASLGQFAAIGSVGYAAIASNVNEDYSFFAALQDGLTYSYIKPIEWGTTPLVWGADLIADDALGWSLRKVTGGYDVSSVTGVGEGGIPALEAHGALFGFLTDPGGTVERGVEAAQERVDEIAESVTNLGSNDDEAEQTPTITTIEQAQARSAQMIELYQMTLAQNLTDYQDVVDQAARITNHHLGQVDDGRNPEIEQQLRDAYAVFTNLDTGKFATDLEQIGESSANHTLRLITELDAQIQATTDVEAAHALVTQQQTLINEMNTANAAIIEERERQVTEILNKQFGDAIRSNAALPSAVSVPDINVELPNGDVVASGEGVVPSDLAIAAVLAASPSPDDITLVNAVNTQSATVDDARILAQQNVEAVKTHIEMSLVSAHAQARQFHNGTLNVLMEQVDNKIADGGDAEKYEAIKAQLTEYAEAHSEQITNAQRRFMSSASQIRAYVEDQAASFNANTITTEEANKAVSLQFIAHQALLAMYADFGDALENTSASTDEDIVAFQDAIIGGEPLANTPGVDALNFAVVDLENALTAQGVDVAAAQSAVESVPVVPIGVEVPAGQDDKATDDNVVLAQSSSSGTPPVPQWQRTLNNLKSDANSAYSEIQGDAAQVRGHAGDANTENSVRYFIRDLDQRIAGLRDLQHAIETNENGAHGQSYIDREEDARNIGRLITAMEQTRNQISAYLPALDENNEHVQGHLERSRLIIDELNTLNAQSDLPRARVLLSRLETQKAEIEVHKDRNQNDVYDPVRRAFSGAENEYQNNHIVKNANGAYSAFYDNIVGFGGEHGVLAGIFRPAGPDGQSRFGQGVSAVFNGAAAVREGWIETMRQNSKTESGRLWMNGLNTAFVGLGGLAALSIFRQTLGWVGIDIPKPISVIATLGIIAWALSRSGEVGAELAGYQSSGNPYALGGRGGRSQDGGGHVPTAANSNHAPRTANGNGAPGSGAAGAEYHFPVRRADGSADNEIFVHPDGRITSQPHGGEALIMSDLTRQQIIDAVNTDVVAENGRGAGSGQHIPPTVVGDVKVHLVYPGHQPGDEPAQAIEVDYTMGANQVSELVRAHAS